MSETEKFWNRLGYAVVQGYGLTETTSLISLNHPFKVGQRSIGKVLPGREMKLDEAGPAVDPRARLKALREAALARSAAGSTEATADGRPGASR